MARYYALAQRPLITQPPGMSYYGLPEGTIGAVDLAPLGSDQWVFVTGDTPFGSEVALAIGDGTRLEDYSLSASEKSGWESTLGVTVDASWKLIDALWAVLTEQSDPDGELRCKPLMPTAAGNLELHLGGHSRIRTRKMPKDVTKLPHWPQIQRVLQNDYERVRGQAFAQYKGKGKPDIHEKVLGAMALKYRMTPDAASVLIAGGRDFPKKPTTTITDDFNRADGAIGSSAEGWAWTILNGAMVILNNTCVEDGQNTFTWGRAEANLSSDDHYVNLTAAGSVASNTENAPLVRYDSASDSHYGMFCDTSFDIFKRVAGAYAAISAISYDATTTGSVHRLEADGSTLTGYKDGVVVGSATDTSITGYVRTGLRVRNAGAVDNFTATDIVAGYIDDLTATADGTTIDLAWSSIDVYSPWAEHLSIERSGDGTNYSEIVTVAANATSYSDTGLSGGTQYWYRIRAVDTDVTPYSYSAPSNVATATTSGGGSSTARASIFRSPVFNSRIMRGAVC